jgi:hypothetical protein
MAALRGEVGTIGNRPILTLVVSDTMIRKRIPLGTPNCCPACSRSVAANASDLEGFVACAHCGEKLWFVVQTSDTRFFNWRDALAFQNYAARLLAAQLGVSSSELPALLRDLAADSLDIVDMVAELDEELDE